MNFIHGSAQSGRFVSDGGDVTIDLPGGHTTVGPVTLGIRPEDLYVADAPTSKQLSEPIRGNLEVQEPMGNEIVVYVHVGPEIRLVARVDPQPLEDGPLLLRADLGKLHVFDRESGQAIPATRQLAA